MKSSYNRLGDYIREYDARNKNGNVNNLIGVSISKDFIPSVANVIGTDLKNYKVIKKNIFACSLMQVSRDGGIAISLYNNDYPSIMSPAYHLFEVISKDLLPEYLELIFKSSEFDRAAVFYAVGGVRGTLTWDEFTNMRIYIPTIDEQQKIVHNYQVITDRIGLLNRIRENLLNQIISSFYIHKMSRKVKLVELTKNKQGVMTGKGADEVIDKKDVLYNVPVIGASGIMGYTNKCNSFSRILSTGRVGTIGKVMVWEGNNWFTDNSIMISTNYLASLFALLSHYSFDEIKGGSSNPKITQSDLNNVEFEVPSDELMELFEKKSKKIFDVIFLLEKEINILSNICSNILKIV